MDANKGKFKVGDRVRFVPNGSGDNHNIIGKTGTITGERAKTSCYQWSVTLDEYSEHGHSGDGDIKNGYGRYAVDADLELAPKFAVGDRVRLIKSGAYNSHGEYGKTGEHGSVVQYADYDDTYEIVFDESGRWWAEANNLEPIAVAQQPQLTIQAGRYYKTRDGRKVGPMKFDRWYDTFYGEGVRWQISHDGVALGNHAESDLIAEWVDEPAVAEPKFKVGDEVAYVNPKFGTAKVVEIVDDNHVRVDTRGVYRICTENVKDLRLVAPATSGKFKVGDKVRTKGWSRFYEIGKVSDTHIWVKLFDGTLSKEATEGREFEFEPTPKPAIVALIENGQPKPSTYPFVHPDREAATKEARRLASKHNGQEFGVYELVSSKKQAKVYEHEWQRLAVSGQKIAAIKEVRSATGFTLKGAKDAVEHWLAVEAA